MAVSFNGDHWSYCSIDRELLAQKVATFDRSFRIATPNGLWDDLQRLVVTVSRDKDRLVTRPRYSLLALYIVAVCTMHRNSFVQLGTNTNGSLPTRPI